jgi:hypothetical protein
MPHDPLHANESLLFSRQTRHGRDGDSFMTDKNKVSKIESASFSAGDRESIDLLDTRNCDSPLLFQEIIFPIMRV